MKSHDTESRMRNKDPKTAVKWDFFFWTGNKDPLKQSEAQRPEETRTLRRLADTHTTKHSACLLANEAPGEMTQWIMGVVSRHTGVSATHGGTV